MTTTVIDPTTGAATVTYNRSGATIVSLTGGFSPINTAGSPNGNEGVDIPRLSETTVLLATTPTVFDGTGVNVAGWNMVYRLPVDAEIGDVIEIYMYSVSPTHSGGPNIFPQIGEEILTNGIPGSAVSNGTNGSAVGPGPGASGCRYRKISSTTWVVIS
jgi:hypothetical protein